MAWIRSHKKGSGGGEPPTIKQVYSSDNTMSEDTNGYVTNTSIYGVVPINNISHKASPIAIDPTKSWEITLRFCCTSFANATRVLMGNNTGSNVYYIMPSMETSANGASIIGRCSTNGSSWTHSLTITQQLVVDTWYYATLSWAYSTGTLTFTLKNSDGSSVIDTQSTSMSTAARTTGILAIGTIAQQSQYIASTVKFDIDNCSIRNAGEERWKPTNLTNDIDTRTKILLYQLNQSQGGVWVNTNIDARNYDKFLFVSSNSGVENYTITKSVSDIAVYTGGQDVYTTVFPANLIGKDFNVRIYNNLLYVSYNGAGAASLSVEVYQILNIDETNILSGVTQPTSSIGANGQLYLKSGLSGALLHFNDTVTNDECGNTWTTTGSPAISSTQSKFGGNSLYLDGSSYIQSSATDVFNFVENDFTISCWVYPTTTNRGAVFAMSTDCRIGTDIFYGQSSANMWLSSTGSNWNILQSDNSGTNTGQGTIALSANTWTHLAYVRHGGNATMYVNGQVARSATLNNPYASVFFNGNDGLRIGAWGNGNYKFKGYIDEFLVFNGVALWTDIFTPPTEPFSINQFNYVTDTYAKVNDDWQNLVGTDISDISSRSDGQLNKINPFTGDVITTLNSVKTTVVSSSVVDKVGEINFSVAGDNSREGINVQLDNLVLGHQYLLMFNMQMTSGTYLYYGYSQGISLTLTPVTEYVLSGGAQLPFYEDLNDHLYCKYFIAEGSTQYLIIYFVDVTNSTQYFTMKNITVFDLETLNKPLPLEYKTYLKFNGKGYVLPWSLNADYKIEVVFYESTYSNNSCIVGNNNGNSRMHLTEYSNKYYTSTGSSETSFGTWTTGEHTFINNNGSGKNEFDSSVVTDYTPTTLSNIYYTVGCRGNSLTSNAYYGWIKSYKIYSITSGTLLHHLIPVIMNGVSGFYDNVEDKVYIVQGSSAVDTIS